MRADMPLVVEICPEVLVGQVSSPESDGCSTSIRFSIITIYTPFPGELRDTTVPSEVKTSFVTAHKSL